jgi:amidase
VARRAGRVGHALHARLARAARQRDGRALPPQRRDRRRQTNTPELGLLPVTEPVAFGPTRNPWDPTRTPGGSSGGAGAAVAAGFVPIAGGGDGGGSIRIPSSCCGLFGLKPTRGRTPMGPDHGEAWQGCAIEHVLTRTVRDSAAMLDAVHGPEPGDPYAAPPPARPFSDEVGAPPGRLKIAWTPRALIPTEVHPECVRAVESAAALLRELGHEVVEAPPPSSTAGSCRSTSCRC